MLTSPVIVTYHDVPPVSTLETETLSPRRCAKRATDASHGVRRVASGRTESWRESLRLDSESYETE